MSKRLLASAAALGVAVSLAGFSRAQSATADSIMASAKIRRAEAAKQKQTNAPNSKAAAGCVSGGRVFVAGKCVRRTPAFAKSCPFPQIRHSNGSCYTPDNRVK